MWKGGSNYNIIHKVTMKSNRHPSTETISMVKMPSWECISPFPKTRCLELGSEQQPHRGAAETNAPLELGL